LRLQGSVSLWDNVKGDPPATTIPYCRVSIKHVSSRQTTFGEIGCRSFQRNGVVIVQLFTPTGEGSTQFDTLAKTISEAFEGVSTPNNLWFRRVSPPIEVGKSGEWYQTNISADFEYDQKK
jgi:hypothetical protein